MADFIEQKNKTIPAVPTMDRCSYGVADSWHGVIEKTAALENGATGPTTRINVEVKSIKDLMSHYDLPTKR